MRLKMLGIILIIFMVSAFLGCGEGDEGATPAEEFVDIPDPCGLLTKADIEEILGGPVADALPIDGPDSRSCEYSMPDMRSGGISIIKPCSMADYSNMAEGEPVEGIGMHAGWDGTTLTVHTMNNECLLAEAFPGGNDPDAALEGAKAVAMKVLENMGS